MIRCRRDQRFPPAAHQESPWINSFGVPRWTCGYVSWRYQVTSSYQGLLCNHVYYSKGQLWICQRFFFGGLHGFSSQTCGKINQWWWPWNGEKRKTGRNEVHLMLVFMYFMHGLLGNFMVNILPCGKRSHNYGKSPFLMGKSTINHHVQ